MVKRKKPGRVARIVRRIRVARGREVVVIRDGGIARIRRPHR